MTASDFIRANRGEAILSEVTDNKRVVSGCSKETMYFGDGPARGEVSKCFYLVESNSSALSALHAVAENVHFLVPVETLGGVQLDTALSESQELRAQCS